MALFAVERFMGHEDGIGNAGSLNQATSILERIHQEARRRKSIQSTSDSPRSKSKQKTKRDNSDTGDDIYSPSEAAQETPTKKRKKQLKSFTEVRYEKDDHDGLSERLNNAKITKSIGKQKKVKSNVNTQPVDNDMPHVAARNREAVEEEEEEEEAEMQDLNQNEDDAMAVDLNNDGHDSAVSTGQTHQDVGGFTVIGEVQKQKTQKVHRVLPNWLSHPAVIHNDLRNNCSPLTDIKGLDDSLIQKLQDSGIHSFFPVQRQVIPVLLNTSEGGMASSYASYRPSDICCSAPTGSGKTLAFVLPIIQTLSRRVVCRVRALCVLPVRDLATQVYKVFQTYAKDTNLKIGLIIGQKAFASEQLSLVKNSVRGPQSQVDIVVATPGRLVDHINHTRGFSLQHLRYLVIDEADRMMGDIKQDWLTQVETAVYVKQGSSAVNKSSGDIAMAHSRPLPGPLTAASAGKMEMPLQKLLFSATLSQNPEKLQQLNLFQPKLFTSVIKAVTQVVASSESVSTEKAGEMLGNNASGSQTDSGDTAGQVVTGDKQVEFVGRYTTPAGLTEYFVQTTVNEKPLVILHMLHHLRFRHVICFTNSLEATHRLYHLIKLVGNIEVREFSSSLHAVKRTRILKQFASGKIDVLISSDAMARGMDVENVQYVISYESPPYIKTYIHRVGRTARAGKVGTAVTLLEKKKIFHFKKLLKDAGKTDIKELKLSRSDLQSLVAAYKGALQELPDILKAERVKHKPRQ